MRAIRKIAILGAALAAFGTIGVGTALADPPPGTTPALTDIVGVGGSVTSQVFSGSPTENVAGALSPDYNATDPLYKLYSWDSSGSSPIVTKGTGTTCSIARPRNTNQGIAALNLSTMISDDYCIDFARSSRGPNPGTADAFVSLAKDAIAWSHPAISGETSPQPASLTRAQLVSIYTCVDTNWDQVGGANAPIVPVVPQSISDTRATFLGELGITATSEPCWVNGVAPNGDVIEENTGLSAGNVDQFTSAGAQDDIFPYSIGDWIAQTTPAVKGTGTAATLGGHASSGWGHGNLELGETVTPSGVAEEPVTTNSTGQPVINPSWSSQFIYTLYDVVRNGCPSTGACFPTAPPYEAAGLPAIFGSTGWICTNATAQSDIVSYEFTLLGSKCGLLTPGI